MTLEIEVDAVHVGTLQVVLVRVGPLELRVHSIEEPRAHAEDPVEAEACWTLSGREIAWPEWGEA